MNPRPEPLEVEIEIDDCNWAVIVFGMCRIDEGVVSFESIDVPDTKVWYLAHVTMMKIVVGENVKRPWEHRLRKIFSTVLTDGDVYFRTTLRRIFDPHAGRRELRYDHSEQHSVVYKMRPKGTMKLLLDMAIARYNAKMELQ